MSLFRNFALLEKINALRLHITGCDVELLAHRTRPPVHCFVSEMPSMKKLLILTALSLLTANAGCSCCGFRDYNPFARREANRCETCEPVGMIGPTYSAPAPCDCNPGEQPVIVPAMPTVSPGPENFSYLRTR